MKSNLLLATAGLFFLIFESTKFGERREIPEKEKWKKEFLNHASCPYMGELGWTIYYKYTRLQTCSYDKLLYQKVKTKDLQPSKRIIKPPALKKKIHNLGKILLQLQNIYTRSRFEDSLKHGCPYWRDRQQHHHNWQQGTKILPNSPDLAHRPSSTPMMASSSSSSFPSALPSVCAWYSGASSGQVSWKWETWSV